MSCILRDKSFCHIFVATLYKNVFFFNSFTIFFSLQLKKCGVLDLLMTSIQKNDDNIQALALNIMLTMILDDNILSFCHSSSLTKDLRPILETIKDTDDFMLSNNAKSALQIINNWRQSDFEQVIPYLSYTCWCEHYWNIFEFLAQKN